MNKQPSSTIMTRLCWGVFFLAVLFLAFQVIPRALGQTRSRGSKQSVAAAQMPQVPPPSTGAVSRRPTLPASQLPQSTSGSAGAHAITVPRAPQAPQVILYDQYNNAGTNATSSQDFEVSLDAFDDELADDFVVPGGQTWSVETIDADGVYFNGPGPAQNFNVRFYSNSGGLPGALVASRIGMSYVQVGSTFTVTLSPAVSLAAGTYWVSVQSRQDFTPAGQWGWTDRTVQSNSPAAWQNPGGGFGVCTTWGQRGATCGIDPGVPDQVYRLNGTTSGGGTPTPTPTPSCTPIVVNGSIDTGDPIQTGRIFRDEPPSTCAAPQTCTPFDAAPYHYDAYTFTNTTGSTQCVTVTLDPLTCVGTLYLQSVAYLGSFDPSNICTNYVADIGASPDVAKSFSFDVPAGQTFVVTVNEVFGAGCPSYTLTVSGICPEGTPTPTPTPGQIRLRAGAHRVDGTKVVHLAWTRATSATVDIYRNDAVLATVGNTGSYYDTLTVRGIYTYKVCEAGTTNCSNEVTVTFSGP